MIGISVMCALALGPVQAAAHSDAAAPVPACNALLIIPRQSLSWTSDGFGQVMGGSIPCAPLPGRVKSVQPSADLPEQLRVSQSPSSLRISGTGTGGLVREIAALQWVGPVITWQRLPVPAATFDGSLKALAGWLVSHSFDVTLEDGTVVQIGTEAQRLSVSLGTGSSAVASVPIADVPEGLRLVVRGASPFPEGGELGEGPFLVELYSSSSSVRIATYRDTILDIDLIRTPSQVRVAAVTPSRAKLERALQDLSMTDELMKGAPQDQIDILSRQRVAQQSAVTELRKAASRERVRPTVTPVEARIVNPRTGREYVTISITVTDAPGGDASVPGPGWVGSSPGTPQGRGAPGGGPAAPQGRGAP